jgi:hypothetical protein
MSAKDDAEIAAVSAATGRDPASLRLEERTIVGAEDGARWRVTVPLFPGLIAPGDPRVLIVAPSDTDDPDAPMWVAELAGRGLVPISHEEANLAAFLAANPALPAETVARLVAINLAPRGAERVLVDDSEIDSLLAERASDVAASDRRLTEQSDGTGARDIYFLAALLRRSAVDGLFRLTVSRWHARLAGAALSHERAELLTDVLLKRYGG